MKKKLLIGVSYVLLIALTLTATVAYFTDTDSAVNVMTVGNIDIEQHEYQRKDGVAHTGTAAKGDLVPFKQGQLLMPAYPVPGETLPYTAEATDLFFWGDYVFSGTAGNGLWNDEKLGNVMDKMVFVENTGKNDLYFRTIIAFECPEGMEYSEGSDKEFMMNVNGSSLYVWEDLADYITIDGVRYLVKVATYQNKLQPGNQAHPSLLQVVMTHNVEQEDAAKLGGSYEILVVTQAVQADMGVKDRVITADEALDAAFGDITTTNHPWTQAKIWDGDKSDALTPDATDNKVYVINTAEDLAALADLVNNGETFAGKTVKLNADIDLSNKEWTPIGTSAHAFQGTFDGQDHTVSNLVVTGYKSNVGLFGFTTNGEIKNLTVENAQVSGRLNVGAVCGTPYTSKYTNVTVTGLVQIEGMSYVGAVGGKNAYANWTDVTVDVDAGSYVKAVSVEDGIAYRTYVGGVIGFMGEGGHTFKNVISNIDVIGSTCDVGGITGIAHYGNNFVNCSSSGNVTLTNASDASDAEEIGGIAGVWNNASGYTVTFEGCSYTGKLSVNVNGVDLTDNIIVGKAYSSSGNGTLVIK
ncbi:MAG: hypothetical protein IJP27_05990 [Clostridia bacterium]|nr:hypothetical protein [Clostridia bacterium]